MTHREERSELETVMARGSGRMGFFVAVVKYRHHAAQRHLSVTKRGTVIAQGVFLRARTLLSIQITVWVSRIYTCIKAHRTVHSEEGSVLLS